MKETRSIYCIVGQTKSNHFKCVGFSKNLKKLIDEFTLEYPRFKGVGKILCQNSLDNKISSLNWEILNTFRSSKELKHFLD